MESQPDHSHVIPTTSETYTNAAIERGSLRPGDTMCVRTNGHRLALITIATVSEQAVEFGATVWVPPLPP